MSSIYEEWRGHSQNFRWEGLGLDEGGLPLHLPMAVNIKGQGPENDSEAHHYECWCGDPKCPLTLALVQAWHAGTQQGVE